MIDVGIGRASPASLVLVGVAVGLSLRQGLGFERTILWAATRAFVQLRGRRLGADRWCSTTTRRSRSPWPGWWLMVRDRRRHRSPAGAARCPGIFPLALRRPRRRRRRVAQVVLFGLGIFPFEPVAIVPLAGMVIGNSLGGDGVGRPADGGRAGRAPPRGRGPARPGPAVAGGLPALRARRAAHRPHRRRSRSTKVVGLIALPGAMTGLILAGVDPVDAVLVQIVGDVPDPRAAATTTAVVVGVGVTRRLFTPDHRLVRLARVVARLPYSPSALQRQRPGRWRRRRGGP